MLARKHAGTSEYDRKGCFALRRRQNRDYGISKSETGKMSAGKQHEILQSRTNLEIMTITETLKQSGEQIAGKGGAAELLGINVSALHARMKKPGIVSTKLFRS